MKKIAIIAAVVLLAIAGVGAGAAFYFKPSFLFAASEPTDTPQPAVATSDVPSPESLLGLKRRSVSLLDKLGIIQDRIAHGDRSALVEQRQLLADAGAAIRYYERRDWQDFASVRASFLYVLSGGDPSVLKPFINGDAGSDDDRKLAEGILRFAKGQGEKASKIIDAFDPRTLDASLNGPFALARGSLHIADDPAAATAFLDEARLASPHTAIEEAALRREIPLLVSMGNTDRAIEFAADYVHRFGQSIYAKKLFVSFGAALAKRSDLDEAKTVAKLADALDPKDSNANSEMFLAVAGQALLRGRLAMTKSAAAEVLKNPSSRPAGLEQARLYQAAADAPSGLAGEAIKALGDISADKLSDDDAQIFDVADYISREVQGHDAPAAAASPGNLKLAKDDTASGSPINQDFSRISGALSDADEAVNHADLLALGTTK